MGENIRPTTEAQSPVAADIASTAWLDAPGKPIGIRGSVSIGRSPKNTVILDSPKVSRRHAVINLQNIGECWLIDLGSSNGTFLNRRRIAQPVRLSDQDQIVIGDHSYVFRQPEERAHLPTVAQRTVRQIENVACWLLVADIENFTPMSRSMVSDKLATLLGGWVSACKETIEEHSGTIDKYLGDGFLAYWRDDPPAAADVAATLGELKKAQPRNEPRFRLALHFGLVAVGGLPSMGEESLMGKDVNFVFRMEKLAGALGIAVLTSAAANGRLGALLPGTPSGSHALKGFEGTHEFFAG